MNLLPQLCPCGAVAVLRLRPTLVMSTMVEYLEYQCTRCQHHGGLAVTEAEAAAGLLEAAIDAEDAAAKKD